MNLIIENFENAEVEPLQKAIERAKYFMGDSEFHHAVIRVQPRQPDTCIPSQFPGWLEYWICFHKYDNEVSSFTIAMIQRTKNAEFEFHS